MFLAVIVQDLRAGNPPNVKIINREAVNVGLKNSTCHLFEEVYDVYSQRES